MKNKTKFNPAKGHFFNKSTSFAALLALTSYSAISFAEQQQYNFNIPAGSLSSALVQFVGQSGILISSDAALTQGKQTAGLSGGYSTAAGLQKLLKNSDLKIATDANGNYILAEADIQQTDQAKKATNTDVDPNSALVLEIVNVEGQAESAYGPVEGYVARRTATGSKTDTPLIEIPQSISIITTEQMKVQGAQSLQDALGYTAGVVRTEANDLTGDGFIVRGFRVGPFTGNIYRDGTKGPINFYDGATEPYGLERLELLKGASSVLYGQAGPGGILNMITKRPTLDPLGEVNVAFGTHNRKQISADVGDRLTDDGVWSYRLTGLFRDSETMTDYVDDDRIYIAPAITWRPNDATSLTLLANYQKSKTAYVYALPVDGTINDTPHGKIPRNRFTGEPGFDKTEMEVINISSLFEHKFNQNLTLRNNTRYYESKGDFLYIYGGGIDAAGFTTFRGASDRENSSESWTTDTSLEYKFNTGAISHTLLVGADYTDARYDSARYDRTVDNINFFNPVYGSSIGPRTPSPWAWKDRRKSYGLYFQDQLKIQDKWVVTLGGRQDWTEYNKEAFFSGIKEPEEKHDAFTGRAGVVYLADNGLAPFISYSQSFQPQRGTDRSGKLFDPTTGDQYEVGIRYQPENSNTLITAAIYQLTKQNVLTTDPVGIGFSVQTGEIQSRGFELEVKTNIGENAKVIAAYAYTDAKVTKDNNPDDVGLANGSTPKNQFSIWGEYEFSKLGVPGLTAGVGMRYVDKTAPLFSFLNAQIPDGVPSYTLYDAMVSYDTKQWRYAVNVKNLTDETYVTCTYGCFYGNERTIIGSVSYKW